MPELDGLLVVLAAFILIYAFNRFGKIERSRGMGMMFLLAFGAAVWFAPRIVSDYYQLQLYAWGWQLSWGMLAFFAASCLMLAESLHLWWQDVGSTLKRREVALWIGGGMVLLFLALTERLRLNMVMPDMSIAFGTAASLVVAFTIGTALMYAVGRWRAIVEFVCDLWAMLAHGLRLGPRF